MIKISNRLEAISSLIPNNSKVIDIGCDHGLLDIYLYQKKISNKIIDKLSIEYGVNKISEISMHKIIISTWNGVRFFEYN